MNLDLTAAIEAATSALARELGGEHPDRFARPDATAAVTAAAPLIAAQVAEQIAAAIEAAKRDWMGAPARSAFEAAARIAREAVR